MKSILTAAVLLIAYTAFAQQPQVPQPFKYKSPYLRKLPPRGNDQYFDMRRGNAPLVLQTPAPPAGKLLTTLPNGNKVYALPQDNMPCIVPNIQYTMPNGSGNQMLNQSQPGAIPNPGTGARLIPVKHVEAPAATGSQTTQGNQ
jgi:hypothetical protein